MIRLQWARAALALGVAIVVGGCDSPKDANKANFSKAIAAHLNKECQHTFLIGTLTGGWPHTVLKQDTFDNPADYAALISAGVLSSVEGTKAIPLGNFPGADVKVFPAVTFDITDEGKKHYVEETGFGHSAGFCLVRYHVASVDNFTPPQNFMGQTVSNVTITQAADVEPWVTPEVRKQFLPNLKATASVTVGLVLTDNGWMDGRDFGK